MRIKTLGFILKLTSCGSEYKTDSFNKLSDEIERQNKYGNGYKLYILVSLDGVATKISFEQNSLIDLKGF
jgi:hypothetical protein